MSTIAFFTQFNITAKYSYLYLWRDIADSEHNCYKNVL